MTVMRLGAVAAIFLMSTVAGHANERIRVNIQTYAISGKTGADLYGSMVKRGPRHGFVSRAIAQTSYKVAWKTEVDSKGGTCRVLQAQPVLHITYTYPQPPRAMAGAVKRRWDKFMIGVKRHEQAHGSIARAMVRVAESSVKGLSVRNDPSCRKTRSEVKRRADRIYADFEAKQIKFDASEHRDGGNIDRLILALVRD